MNYAKIKNLDIANGEGLRVSLFVSGCPHHCNGCFNPETWDYNYGKKFTKQTESEILEMCAKPHIAGLSLLGGEPLTPENAKRLLSFCKRFKKMFPGKNIWCYTGFTWEQIHTLQILDYIDVLVDGRFELSLKSPKLRFRGSSNQRIIDVKMSLKMSKVVLYCE